MKIGKLSNEDLESLVLSRISFAGAPGEAGPSVGLDCAVMDLGDGLRLVLSSDPVTAADADAGRLAIQVSCNDIAAAGVRPAGIMVVLVIPPDCTQDRIRDIMDQIVAVTNELGIRVAGGHTEVSDAVTRILITTTAFGWTRGPVILSSGGRPGDILLMTKTAGLEGTAILAKDRREELAAHLGAEAFQKAYAMLDSMSVVTEGETGARLGVHAMHDATEGGVLGACWELCHASGVGCILRAGDIPVHPVTAQIAGVFGMDPLRLIASGSMILATDRPDELVKELACQGVLCTPIGVLENGSCRMLLPGGTLQELPPPGADELYKSAVNSYY